MTKPLEITKWDRRFLTMATLVGAWSKDPSTKVGCVISRGNRVISIGFNGYPHGLKDTHDSRELKYAKTIHAEINAILHANTDLTGCYLYTSGLPPCSRCATVIIQSNIKRIYTTVSNGEALTRWYKETMISERMFNEAGIQLYSEIRSCQ